MKKGTWMLRLLLAYLLLPSPAFPQDTERAYEIYKPNYPDKVIKVVEVRNLQSANFPGDLEIEVKNVSSKPIYYLDFGLVFPKIRYGFDLSYGRFDLVSLGHRDRHPQDDDKPINPGESVTFKVGEMDAKGLQHKVLRDSNPPESTNLVRIVFQYIDFGDGTGILAGSAYPVKR